MKTFLPISLLAALTLALAATVIAPRSPSKRPTGPQFRGPGTRGIGTGDALPDSWSATENVAWKTDIPGRGWGSPIVWGDKVFLSSVINSGESEEPNGKRLYFGGNRPDNVPDDSSSLGCLLFGSQLWDNFMGETLHEAPCSKPIDPFEE